MSESDEFNGAVLPADVVVGNITYRKGVKLSVLVNAARRWKSQVAPMKMKGSFDFRGSITAPKESP